MISMKPHLYPSNDCLLNVAVYVTDYLSRGDNSMKTIDLIYFIKVKSSNIVITCTSNVRKEKIKYNFDNLTFNSVLLVYICNVIF